MRMWGRRHPTEEELSLLIDGRLSDRDRRRIEAHLQECAECRAAYEDLQRTVLLLQHAPRLTPPRAFTLSQADVHPASSSPREHRWARVLLPWATALVGLVLIAVIGLQALLLLGGLAATSSGPHEYTAYLSTKENVGDQPITPQMEMAQAKEAPNNKSDAAAPLSETPTPMVAVARASIPLTPKTTVEEPVTATVESPQPRPRAMLPVSNAPTAPQPAPSPRGPFSTWLILLDAGLFLLFIILVGLFIHQRRRA